MRNERGFIGETLLVIVGGIGLILGFIAINSGEFEQSFHVPNECPRYIYGPLVSGQLESSYWALSTVQAQSAKMLFIKFPGAVWRVENNLVEVLMDHEDGTQSWVNIGCDETGQWLYLECEIPEVMKNEGDSQGDQIIYDHLIKLKYGIGI